MEEMNLKDFWISLESNEQVRLLDFFSVKLLTKPQTAMSYLYGGRNMPAPKRKLLVEHISKRYNIAITA